MIEAFHVGAVSRGRALWEGLTLAVRSGEIWVVTGPPSCGKTLLMRILRGERRPDSGDVLVSGESLYRGSPDHNREFRSSSGVVPESFPGEGDRTVEDLFRLSALAVEGMEERDRKERMEGVLSMVGLSGVEGAAVASLSASERARAALAAELFRSPKYLFLDMLLANAGTEWADRLVTLFRALAREERTFVMMERRLPDRWGTDTGSPPVSLGPFRIFRLGGPLRGGGAAVEGAPPAEKPSPAPDGDRA